MATKTRSKSRSMGSGRMSGRGGSQTGSSEAYGGGRRAGLRGRVRGAIQGAAQNGVRVKAEMAEPKVARIMIEIDWEQLASRMARKAGRAIKKRVAGRPGRTRRASTR